MLKRFWNWLLGQTTIDERIEEKVDNVKKTIVAVKKEIADVKDAIEDVVDEAQDVYTAATGKITKSSLREMTKKQLIEHASKDFSVDLKNAESKSNLINKVYNLHHKK